MDNLLQVLLLTDRPWNGVILSVLAEPTGVTVLLPTIAPDAPGPTLIRVLEPVTGGPPGATVSPAMTESESGPAVILAVPRLITGGGVVSGSAAVSSCDAVGDI